MLQENYLQFEGKPANKLLEQLKKEVSDLKGGEKVFVLSLILAIEACKNNWYNPESSGIILLTSCQQGKNACETDKYKEILKIPYNSISGESFQITVNEWGCVFAEYKNSEGVVLVTYHWDICLPI